MFIRYRLLAMSLLLSAGFVLAPRPGVGFQADDKDLPPPDFSVETKGPVHEAFAAPFFAKPEVPVVVPKEPPPMIPEKAPDERPDNPNVEWIPGYWSWDSDRNDFIWVSGTFREPPNGRRWMPGHWAQGGDGWQWVPGFWARENQAELQYTPEPPAPLEDGPTSPQPTDDAIWIPGYWSYNTVDQRFTWVAGYWAAGNQDQVWMGPQYYWTPSGYAYNSGYWDYPVNRRGLLFAPVFFPNPLWNNAGWFYRPNYVVPYGSFYGAAFYRPGYNSFFFGNFYGNNYTNLGYRPWYGLANDPTFAYARWQNRANPQWAAAQRTLYADRIAGRAALPPSTFAAQQALIAKGGAAGNAFVTSLSRYTPANGKLVANTQAAVNNLQIRQTQDLANLRAKSEVFTKGGAATAAAGLKLPPAAPRIWSSNAAAISKTSVGANLPAITNGAGNLTPRVGANPLGGAAGAKLPQIVNGLPNAGARMPEIVNGLGGAAALPRINNGVGGIGNVGGLPNVGARPNIGAVPNIGSLPNISSIQRPNIGALPNYGGGANIPRFNPGSLPSAPRMSAPNFGGGGGARFSGGGAAAIGRVGGGGFGGGGRVGGGGRR